MATLTLVTTGVHFAGYGHTAIDSRYSEDVPDAPPFTYERDLIDWEPINHGIIRNPSAVTVANITGHGATVIPSEAEAAVQRESVALVRFGGSGFPAIRLGARDLTTQPQGAATTVWLEPGADVWIGPANEDRIPSVRVTVFP